MTVRQARKGVKLNLPQLSCYACGHRWIPRNPQPPAVCSKCKSRKWNVRPPKDRSNPANMTPGDKRLVERFLDFCAKVHPARVKPVLETMETELLLLKTEAGRRRKKKQP